MILKVQEIVPKLVVLHSLKISKSLTEFFFEKKEKFLRFICADKIFKPVAGKFFKKSESRDILF